MSTVHTRVAAITRSVTPPAANVSTPDDVARTQGACMTTGSETAKATKTVIDPASMPSIERRARHLLELPCGYRV